MARAHLARGGFNLVELVVVLGIVAVLMGLLLPTVQKVREAGNRITCQNNLHEMVLALHGYHDTYSHLPPGATLLNQPYAFLNWQARILPWLEQGAAWAETERAFAANPNFSVVPPHNIRQVPMRVYICPSDGRQIGTPQPENTKAGLTHYLGVSGSGGSDGLLYGGSQVRWAEVTDGLSNTLLVGERPPSSDQRFGWWYAGVGQNLNGDADSYLSMRERNSTFRAPTCPTGPYHYEPGTSGNMCDTFHFWSRHPGGANFAFADGSVRFLPYSTDPLMPALASRAGGEALSLEE